jgi:hypothetical protein
VYAVLALGTLLSPSVRNLENEVVRDRA